MKLHKDETPITSLESWFELAPPKKGAAQWVDLRSAKEFARSFFASGSLQLPQELNTLLCSSPDTGSTTSKTTSPDVLSRQTRNQPFRHPSTPASQAISYR